MPVKKSQALKHLALEAKYGSAAIPGGRARGREAGRQAVGQEQVLPSRWKSAVASSLWPEHTGLGVWGEEAHTPFDSQSWLQSSTGLVTLDTVPLCLGGKLRIRADLCVPHGCTGRSMGILGPRGCFVELSTHLSSAPTYHPHPAELGTNAWIFPMLTSWFSRDKAMQSPVTWRAILLA